MTPKAYVPITSWLDKQLYKIACERRMNMDDLTNEVLTDYVRRYFYSPKETGGKPEPLSE